MITEKDYPSLKAFFVAWEDRFPPDPELELPPEDYPVAVLESFERTSMSKARQGLELALNDIMEWPWDISPDEAASIDRDFAARGIMTFSEMLRRYSRYFRRLLKRGKIQTEQDYYLAKGILDSFTTDAGEDERCQLEAMLSAYEESPPKTKQKN